MKNEFNIKYPLLTNVLEAYLRPEVDSYNLITTLYIVMKSSPAAMAEGLVKELKQLVLEDKITDECIINEFNFEIPVNYQIMNHNNMRGLLLSLYEYVLFLYKTENFRGAKKWEI